MPLVELIATTLAVSSRSPAPHSAVSQLITEAKFTSMTDRHSKADILFRVRSLVIPAAWTRQAIGSFTESVGPRHSEGGGFARGGGYIGGR